MKNVKIIFVTLLTVLLTFFYACSTPTLESAPSLPEDSQPAPIPPTQIPDETPVVPETKPETVSYANYIRSTVNGLTVRKSTSTSSAKLGYIDKNDMLHNGGKIGDWYKTFYKEQEAYVHASFVTEVAIKKSSSEIEKTISVGIKLLGHPYVYGSQRYHWGNGVKNNNFTPGEYDCSALMQYMFYFGTGDLLDVTSRKQYLQGKEVSSLKRGDLMFFTNAYGQNKVGIEKVRHVGMYLGDNYILHTASDYAVIEPISATRWGYYLGAKRIVG